MIWGIEYISQFKHFDSCEPWWKQLHVQIHSWITADGPHGSDIFHIWIWLDSILQIETSKIWSQDPYIQITLASYLRIFEVNDF